MNTKGRFVTHGELLNAIKELKHDLKHELSELKDEILHNRRASAHDTHEIKEQLMTLQGSTDRLGTVVTKLIADFGGTQTMIQGLKDRIDALVAQGTASAAELAALQAQVATATPKIDSVTDQLQALDDSIKDPNTPLDGNTPV